LSLKIEAPAAAAPQAATTTTTAAPAQVQAPAADPQPGTPEYDAAMIARGAGVQIRGVQPGTPPTEAATQEAPERPEWLPEKFSNPEALAKAYKELEAKLGAPKEAAPAATPETPAAGTAEAAVANAGLDMSTLSAEFAQTGSLSEDSYTKLEKAGIPRAMVDSYIDGQLAVAERQAQEALATVGGKEAYTQMTAWAQQAFSAEETAAYNRMVNSGDPSVVKMAVASLKARYTAERGSAPQLVRGDRAEAPGGAGFRSTQEMMAAMSDSRYGRDPAYTRDVERRATALSSLSGISVRVVR
jgi:hypothetical protein